jgi:uncharacterized protein (TIGR00661 family)
MRILYGVVGEGMGHATRSKVVCEELVRRGHEVKIVVSGRAHGYLAKSFADVVEIRGFEIRYEDNGMALDATIAQNVLAAPEMLQANLLAYYDRVASFRPDVVITDFDSFAGYVARRQGVPLVSIDNQQIIARCKHPKPITKGAKFDFELTKSFVRAKLPSLDYAFVTTFFEPPVKPKYEDATMLVPPILRDAILKAKAIARAGDHVLVYQTSTSDTSLIPTLNGLKGERFYVYGLRRREVIGNCELFDFDEKTFIEHMATAKAVVANGGFTTLSEAVYLGKPIYSVPVRHQYEQEMNGRYLELLGYGAVHESVDAKSLKRFLAEVPRMTARVARHHQDGNALLFEKLGTVLERLARKREKKRRAEAG